MEILLSILAGLGLSAACGFRVFIPLLVTCLALRTGDIQVSGEFEWLSSDAALIALGAASLLEVAAMYIPWLDNALDAIAIPAATVAGTILMASFITDTSPWLQWVLAIIAGGGTAGAISAGTAVIRGVSTGSTGGIGNHALSTSENVGAAGVASASAFIAPVVGISLLIGLAVLLVWGIYFFWRRGRSTPKLNS